MTEDAVIEDWRIVVVPTPSGWRAFLLYEDGVELVESVDLG